MMAIMITVMLAMMEMTPPSLWVFSLIKGLKAPWGHHFGCRLQES